VLEKASVCKRCAAALAADALVCRQCHTLTHADQLEQIAVRAKALEEQKDFLRAKEQWVTALTLLPPEAKQANWIKDHTRKLDLAATVISSTQRPKRSLKRFGPLAPLIVALTKGKAILAILNLKFLLTFGAFVGVYWSVFGMKFGVGFAILILVHEFGHFIDIKRRGLPADLPVFLPGMGAFVRWEAMGVPVRTRAAVSLAGPLAGWGGAVVCTFLWLHTGSSLWAALARSGAWLNLLNLIPIWGLDGGHAFLALTKKHRMLVLSCSVAALLLLGESVFLLVALGATWRLFTRDLPQEPSPLTASYFVAVLSGLSILMWVLPGQGFGTP
jgi:Zn-dependent protease